MGKAIDLDPNEITFYTNMAAVYFEQQDYDKCISTCDKALEVGRENRADFKLVAKAWGRKGNALRKTGNLLEAKTAYEKAITEDRTPEFRNALSEIEAEMKREEQQAYLDPAKGEEEKQKGTSASERGIFLRQSSITQRQSSGTRTMLKLLATVLLATRSSWLSTRLWRTVKKLSSLTPLS